MAVTSGTSTKLQAFGDNAIVHAWAAIPTGNTGAPIETPTWSDRSVQIGGTFGGSTAVLEGSNDGTTYFTLTDPAGVAISVTSAALKQVLQVCRYMRPSVSGGAAASINVQLLVVRK